METLLLGIAQGIFEWLPVSSSAVLLALQANYFQNIVSLEETVELILFLHMGTFFSALIYFHKEIFEMLKNIFSIKTAEPHIKNRIIFLIVSTFISGSIGLLFLQLIKIFDNTEALSFNIINIGIGALLIITGLIQFYTSHSNHLRTAEELKTKDGVILGILQGFAALPGISRSGITIAGLLARKINSAEALRLSFIMGLPITLIGNIVLNFDKFTFKNDYVVGLLSAFIVGILTIHFLMKLTRRINFGYVALLFGIVLVLGGVIPLLLN